MIWKSVRTKFNVKCILTEGRKPQSTKTTHGWKNQNFASINCSIPGIRPWSFQHVSSPCVSNSFHYISSALLLCTLCSATWHARQCPPPICLANAVFPPVPLHEIGLDFPLPRDAPDIFHCYLFCVFVVYVD